MPRVATKLTPTHAGGFVARKRIPADVQDEYQRLYNVRAEARFNSGAVPIMTARAKHREWSSEIEARFANIRAARKGEGCTLTPKQARALAGEWYHWFVEFVTAKGCHVQELEKWQARCEYVLQSQVEAADDDGELSEDEVAKRMRPAVGDWCETTQFLAAKGLSLDTASRDMFLDFIGNDYWHALRLLIRQADGDYRPDKWAERFPQPMVVAEADASLTAWALFERWIAEVKPAASTVDRWRAAFLKLRDDFPNCIAAGLLPEQIQAWAEGLINDERSAGTVRDIWVVAGRTVFAWAIGKKLITRNPFTGWRITVPRKTTTRETKAFTDDEIKTVLNAASAIDARTKGDAAKRWCPWLAAYTGARMGEICQLRGSDVVGHAIKISPEAGTTKTGTARTVPLHEHLIEQGFLAFVQASGDGPLFYKPVAAEAQPNDPTNPRKARYIKARERLAAWVRGLGVNDPELQPNHAWRHTFKAIGFRCGMTEKMIDAIAGHAPATVGRAYGQPTLADKTAALSKFPRYTV
jgi:integrase